MLLQLLSSTKRTPVRLCETYCCNDTPENEGCNKCNYTQFLVTLQMEL